MYVGPCGVCYSHPPGAGLIIFLNYLLANKKVKDKFYLVHFFIDINKTQLRHQKTLSSNSSGVLTLHFIEQCLPADLELSHTIMEGS